MAYQYNCLLIMPLHTKLLKLVCSKYFNNFLTLTSISFGILLNSKIICTNIIHCMPLDVFFFNFNLHLNIAGPSVDSMTLSILSSRDAVPNIAIALSFNVSYGPPSRVLCVRIGTPGPAVTFLNERDPNPKLDREVIRSRYINSTLPDMTRVTVRPGPQPREVATYTCFVHVESRINITSGIYDYDEKGMPGSTTVTVSGELYIAGSIPIIFS